MKWYADIALYNAMTDFATHRMRTARAAFDLLERINTGFQRTDHGVMSIPKRFCWTKFGAKAGQTVDEIFARKEEERRANGGLFLWGIGNAIGSAIAQLIADKGRPEVLFSPIKSKPHSDDVTPAQIIAWTHAKGLDGTTFEIPARALVTSRDTARRAKTVHYALVCYSEEPLRCRPNIRVDIESLRNLRSASPLGFSQVTAVVIADDRDGGSPGNYAVALRARLVPPYFIRLECPMHIEPRDERQTWSDAVAALWATLLRSEPAQEYAGTLRRAAEQSRAERPSHRMSRENVTRPSRWP